MALTCTDFNFIREFAKRTAAIVIDPGKEYFIESRLEPLVPDLGCGTLSNLISLVRNNTRMGTLHTRVIDALTTNETSFFRDFHPYETLRKHIIPGLIEQRSAQRKLSIWSAACSTGQEPYSLSLMLREHFQHLNGWDVSILATDLSTSVLKQAKAGEYTQFEVNRGMPAPMLFKYFTKKGDRWCVKEDLKKPIDFRQMNLIEPWPIFPPFDIVLIRNVMIYFDVPTKQTILKRLRACLKPQGSLLLGTAETTLNLDPTWSPVTLGTSTVYQTINSGMAK